MIQHNHPSLNHLEAEAVENVIRTGWLAQGEQVTKFEEEICEFLDLPSGHAVAVTSGTAALYLALWALNTESKKVAVPVYSCSSLRNAVGMIRARIVLVDPVSGEPNIDVRELDQDEVDLAIVPHMYGIPALGIGQSRIPFIEDCSQAIGGQIAGIPVGLQGLAGVYSFYATKLMTSGGQGGAVVSKDGGLIELIRDYRQFDCRKDEKLRFNFQMTDMQAAVGRAQLRKLPGFLKRRAEIFQRYEENFPMLWGKGTQDRVTPVRYRAVLHANSPREVISALGQKGIKCIVPIERWELLKDSSLFPVAQHLAGTTVSLPIYPNLSDVEVDYIVDQINMLNETEKWF